MEITTLQCKNKFDVIEIKYNSSNCFESKKQVAESIYLLNEVPIYKNEEKLMLLKNYYKSRLNHDSIAQQNFVKHLNFKDHLNSTITAEESKINSKTSLLLNNPYDPNNLCNGNICNSISPDDYNEMIAYYDERRERELLFGSGVTNYNRSCNHNNFNADYNKSSDSNKEKVIEEKTGLYEIDFDDIFETNVEVNNNASTNILNQNDDFFNKTKEVSNNINSNNEVISQTPADNCFDINNYNRDINNEDSRKFNILHDYSFLFNEMKINDKSNLIGNSKNKTNKNININLNMKDEKYNENAYNGDINNKYSDKNIKTNTNHRFYNKKENSYEDKNIIYILEKFDKYAQI